MSVSKYRFNPDTLQYDKVERSVKRRIIAFIPKALVIVLITATLIFVLSDFIETPHERLLRVENEQLLLQYNIMNKRIDEMNNALTEIQKRDNNIYRMIFEAEPVPEDIRKGGFGGVNRYKHLESMSNSKLVIETARKLDELYNQYYFQSKSLDEVIELALYKKEFLESVPSISPISDKEFKRFASGFGYRLHPIYKTRLMHTGIDLTAPTGTPVYVTGKGTVIKAGSTSEGYGKVVIVDHGFGYSTLYAHLHEIDVKKGQKLTRGDLIGTVGSTGRSVAPHLHYEVRFYDKPIDPVNYYFNDLTPEEYDRIIELSQRPVQSFD
ncbi:MAG: M23 family metallopeptidase [Salinivirgaceae bacterium]|jgi:murein DD-endopeptidase MepM/ murein hydrolase activator NlpD|nr:peptidoglycan DD-metalloendopeptidase family protein [Bacteroidales bacterium]